MDQPSNPSSLGKFSAAIAGGIVLALIALVVVSSTFGGKDINTAVIVTLAGLATLLITYAIKR